MRRGMLLGMRFSQQAALAGERFATDDSAYLERYAEAGAMQIAAEISFLKSAPYNDGRASLEPENGPKRELVLQIVQSFVFSSGVPAGVPPLRYAGRK